jgi:hypothetical protein
LEGRASRNGLRSDGIAFFQAVAHDLGLVVRFTVESVQSSQGILVKRDEWATETLLPFIKTP